MHVLLGLLVATASLLCTVQAAPISSVAEPPAKGHHHHGASSHVVVQNYLAHLRYDRNRYFAEAAYSKDVCDVMKIYHPTAMCRDIDRIGSSVGLTCVIVHSSSSPLLMLSYPYLQGP